MQNGSNADQTLKERVARIEAQGPGASSVLFGKGGGGSMHPEK